MKDTGDIDFGVKGVKQYDPSQNPRNKRKGFASMDRMRLLKVSSQGGKTAWRKGKAFKFDTATAIKAAKARKKFRRSRLKQKQESE